ncbi:S8 family serine peptidase [bacterium]|nr:S8 family serine peptidase [bacterium]
MSRYLSIILIIFEIASAGGKYWVFFTDKGLFTRTDTITALANARQTLSQRCLLRRSKVLPPEKIVSIRDVPVCERYIRAVENAGAEIIHRTKWFNGVSVRADEGVLNRISKLPFVKKIRPVAVGRRKILPPPDENDYGAARNQLVAENVQKLHEIGVDGSGVLISIHDTGFNPEHIAFSDMDIVAMWDFVSGDSVVDYEDGDPGGVQSHGSFCLSLLGGFIEDTFSGVAPGASFLLARTEDIGGEAPVEEDNWVAAVEWDDSCGADIISSSLGYYDWYDYSDMDGDTPIITAGADRAVYLGIAVFTAAGNSGPGVGSLVAPGDGDSVITVGACDNYGIVASFSSRGPTYDGRIKPDILAPGVACYGVDGMNDSLFRYGSGTSMATPMAAGVGALLLQIKPSTTPIQLRDALRSTAKNATSPDNERGWGLIDAAAAAAYPVNDTSLIALKEGWNLIAVPVDTFILASSLPIVEPAYTYAESIYITVDTLVPGRGYFVLSSSDTFAVVIGEKITSLPVQLKYGWNLVGGLSRRTFIDEYLDVFWSFYLYGFDSDMGYYLTKSIAPGQGVWLLSNEDRTPILSE